MNRQLNENKKRFSLRYLERRETILHFPFNYLDCVRPQLNSTRTPYLLVFFLTFFVLLAAGTR